MDVFYISYDEPQKEELWLELSARIPTAIRVDGVKGFHKAHKTCALASKSRRFFTIDGDTQPNEAFFNIAVDKKLLASNSVLSWSSKNTLNGLSYGNGGIKNWPRELLFNSKTHEESSDPTSTVDFCFSLEYYLLPEELSTTHIHHSPFQAFRSGFREGIKMALRGGLKITEAPIELSLKKYIHVSNLERLRIWCSVGSDSPNGLWAILGARRGLSYLYLENNDHNLIRDYEWFENFWKTEVLAQTNESHIVREILKYGEAIESQLKLELVLLSAQDSRFFKSVYVNRYRPPQLLRWD